MDLQKKTNPWTWDLAQQNAFELMQARLLQAPVLIHPDANKPFVLHTDASEVGVGASLSPLDGQGIHHLIACRFKKLNVAQKNYPVHEKEMLSSIQALED